MRSQLTTYLCYLWDNSLKKFVENEDLESVPNPHFDPDTKLVTGFERDSASEHVYYTYQYIKGKLTMIEKDDTGVWDNKDQTCYDYTYKLINGEMQLVKKEISSIKG